MVLVGDGSGCVKFIRTFIEGLGTYGFYTVFVKSLNNMKNVYRWFQGDDA